METVKKYILLEAVIFVVLSVIVVGVLVFS